MHRPGADPLEASADRACILGFEAQQFDEPIVASSNAGGGGAQTNHSDEGWCWKPRFCFVERARDACIRHGLPTNCYPYVNSWDDVISCEDVNDPAFQAYFSDPAYQMNYAATLGDNTCWGERDASGTTNGPSTACCNVNGGSFNGGQSYTDVAWTPWQGLLRTIHRPDPFGEGHPWLVDDPWYASTNPVVNDNLGWRPEQACKYIHLADRTRAIEALHPQVKFVFAESTFLHVTEPTSFVEGENMRVDYTCQTDVAFAASGSTIPVYIGPGRSLNEVIEQDMKSSLPPHPDPYLAGFGITDPTFDHGTTPQCLSCDTGSDADPTATLSCVYEQYLRIADRVATSPTANAVAVRNELIAQAKLIYERKYGELEPEQRAQVLELYRAYPDVYPNDFATVRSTPEVCGRVTPLPGDSDWAGPEQRCEALDGVAWRYRYCGRLRSTHADSEWRSDPEALEVCFALSEDLADVWEEASACPDIDSYVALANEMQKDLVDDAKAELAVALGRIDVSNPVGREAERSKIVRAVGDYLSIVGGWLRGARAGVPNGSQTVPELVDEAIALEAMDLVRVLERTIDPDFPFFELLYRCSPPIDGTTAHAIDIADPYYGSRNSDGTLPEDAEACATAEDIRNAFASSVELSGFMEQVIIESLADDPSRIDGAMVLALLGHAFARPADRIHTLMPFHSLGCELIGGCDYDLANPNRPQIADMMSVLSSAHAVPSLLATLDAASARGDMDGWLSSLERLVEVAPIVAYHLNFYRDNAWRDSSAPEPVPPLVPQTSLGAVDVYDLPPSARRLLATLIELERTHDDLEGVGRFTGGVGQSVYTPLHWSYREETMRMSIGSQNLLADFDQELSRFEQRLFTMYRDLLAQANQQTSVVAARERRDALRRQILELGEDVLEIQIDSASLPGTGDLLRMLQDGSRIQPCPSGQTCPADYAYAYTAQQDLSATSATYPLRGPMRSNTPVSTLPAWSLDVSGTGTAGRGYLVSIDVDPADRWSPDCALEDLRFRDPNGTLHDYPTAQNGEVDSSGYVMRYSSSNQRLESNSTSEVESLSVGYRSELCAGMPGVAEAFGPFSSSACVYGSRQEDTATTNRTSEDFVQSSLFDVPAGVYSMSTPFPGAPVGSLVVFELDVPLTGARASNIVSARIVRPGQTSFIARSDYVHFVVNDRQGCSGQSAQPITVTVSTHRPTSQAAEALADAATAAIATIIGRSPSFVALGSVPPEATEALYREAVLDTSAAANVSYDQWPRELRALFDAVFNWEITKLRGRVAIGGLVRQMDRLERQALAIEAELEGLQRGAILAAELPSMTARLLDARWMETRSTMLVGYLKNLVLPILRVWYAREATYPLVVGTTTADTHLPNGLWGWLPTILGTEIAALTDMSLRSPTWEIAEDLRRIAHEIQIQASAVEHVNSLGAAHRYVGLRYERPDSLVRPTDSSRDTHFKTVSTARSFRIWDQLEALGPNPADSVDLSFALSPDDLYDFGPNLLECRDELPIINRIGVAFVDTTLGSDVFYPGAGDAVYNSHSLQWGGDFDANQSLVSAMGSADYRQLNPQWRVLEAPVISTAPGSTGVEPRAILRQIWDAQRSSAPPGSSMDNRAEGVSPFTPFVLRVHRADIPRNHQFLTEIGGRDDQHRYTELVLVLELEYTASFNNVTVARQCAAP